MKLDLSRFNEMLALFLKGVLAPAARTNAAKFRIGWALGSGRAALAKDGPRADSLRASGVMDGSGAIDVEQLKRCVYGGLELSGDLRIDELGLSVERPEVDRFFRLLETGSLS